MFGGFPMFSFDNGGASFLIPYVIMLVVVGATRHARRT